MSKITFTFCPTCKVWAAKVYCPECKAIIRSGELADVFAEEYELQGAYEDALYGELIECDCGWKGYIGEWKRTEKDLHTQDCNSSVKVIFDVEF